MESLVSLDCHRVILHSRSSSVGVPLVVDAVDVIKSGHLFQVARASDPDFLHIVAA